MTADGRLPEADRRNYKHVGDALVRMVREEGLVTLWRGFCNFLWKFLFLFEFPFKSPLN
jgi:hypothetical protein